MLDAEIDCENRYLTEISFLAVVFSGKSIVNNCPNYGHVVTPGLRSAVSSVAMTEAEHRFGICGAIHDTLFEQIEFNKNITYSAFKINWSGS